MIVVSDTTPLHYLILIDEAELLPRILGEVIIPDVVFDELRAANTPDKIKKYLLENPKWIIVKPATGIIDPELDHIVRANGKPYCLRNKCALTAF